MSRDSFVSEYMEDGESVMDVSGANVTQIRFKHDSREIFIITEPVPELTPDPGPVTEPEPVGALEDLHWTEMKRLVIDKGGRWNSKKDGIAYLRSL